MRGPRGPPPSGTDDGATSTTSMSSRWSATLAGSPLAKTESEVSSASADIVVRIASAGTGWLIR